MFPTQHVEKILNDTRAEHVAISSHTDQMWFVSIAEIANGFKLCSSFRISCSFTPCPESSNVLQELV